MKEKERRWRTLITRVHQLLRLARSIHEHMKLLLFRINRVEDTIKMLTMATGELERTTKRHLNNEVKRRNARKAWPRRTAKSRPD